MKSKTTKYRLTNIKWDTDGHSVDLPKQVTLNLDNDVDVAEEGADILSDKYGFCVVGFNFEVVEA